MVVDVRLGNPLPEEDLGPVLRLHRVRHEGVPVVVVTDVVVVEKGEPGAFVLGPDPLVVPLGDHDLAVGVEAGDHDADGVLEDLPHRLVVPGGHLVGDLRDGLAGGHFRGVEPVGLDEDHPSVRHGLPDLGFRVAPGILKDSVPLLDPVQLGQVLRGGDEEGEEGIAEGGGPHVTDLDPVTEGAPEPNRAPFPERFLPRPVSCFGE